MWFWSLCNGVGERNRIMTVNVSLASGSSIWASELRPGVPHCGRVRSRRDSIFSGAGRRAIALMNLIGHTAVQRGDERRRRARDARRCDRTRADGVMRTDTGMRPWAYPAPDAPTNVFMSVFLSKYARGSQLALRHS